MVMAGQSMPVRQQVANQDTLRIVHLALTLNTGGLERVIYDLVHRADRQRYSVQVVCLGEVGNLGPAFSAIGVPVESLDVHGNGILRSVFRLARRLRELRPDVLHTHNPAAHIVGAPAARIAHIPKIVHTRHGQHRQKGWKAIFGNRMATWLTDQIVAVSKDAAEIARQDDGVRSSSLSVIQNGIDLERFAYVDRQGAITRHRAIHVARLNDSVKDQTTLLHAARAVVDAEPQFVMDIIGDGPSRGELEILCDELQLRRHVKFLGYRDDVQNFLQHAGFFVLSSVTEGLSISLLEAMATGLPIVATDVGGNPELVTPGKTGLLVPPRDPTALAAAMLTMLRNSEQACQMGLRGRQRAEKEFDLRVVTGRYEELYRRLLNR